MKFFKRFLLKLKTLCMPFYDNGHVLILHSGVHVTLESLLLDNDLKIIVKDMVMDSGRSFPGKNGAYRQENEKHVACSEKLVEKVQKEFSTVQLNGNSNKGTEILT